jgi:hypothetical protein
LNGYHLPVGHPYTGNASRSPVIRDSFHPSRCVTFSLIDEPDYDRACLPGALAGIRDELCDSVPDLIPLLLEEEAGPALVLHKLWVQEPAGLEEVLLFLR